MEIRRSVMERPNLSVRGTSAARIIGCWPETGARSSACRLVRFDRLLNRRLGQRHHDLVSRSIGVQAVVGEVAFEQAFVVDHGGEVIEIEAVGVLSYVGL